MPRLFVVAASVYIGWFQSSAQAFALPLVAKSSHSADTRTFRVAKAPLHDFLGLSLRGGGEEETHSESYYGDDHVENTEEIIHNVEEPVVVSTTASSTTSAATKPKLALVALLPSTLLTWFRSVGQCYATSLTNHPIYTKSLTSSLIFALSDYLAQRLSQRRPKSNNDDKQDTKPVPINWTRVSYSAGLGLLVHGPAVHYWYSTIFRLLPATTLVSSIQKAILGQIFFGPFITCMFFASALLQSGRFSLSNWASKIQRDLPSAWIAGTGFWPLVDLISYTFVPLDYIPLFVNFCSLVWTIFLSLISNI